MFVCERFFQEEFRVRDKMLKFVTGRCINPVSASMSDFAYRSIGAKAKEFLLATNFTQGKNLARGIPYLLFQYILVVGFLVHCQRESRIECL